MNVHSKIKIFFLLLTLGLHLFFGSHDLSSSLVLCLGDNGHVGVEVLPHSPHSIMISDHSSQENLHSEACSEQEDCRDISISIDHDELYVLQRLSEFKAHHVIHQYPVPQFTDQSYEQPFAMASKNALLPLSAGRKTLRSVVLLI